MSSPKVSQADVELLVMDEELWGEIRRDYPEARSASVGWHRQRGEPCLRVHIVTNQAPPETVVNRNGVDVRLVFIAVPLEPQIVITAVNT